MPVVLQLLNVAGFISYNRLKRKEARKALDKKCEAINAHFVGRNVNFVIKSDAAPQSPFAAVVIEVRSTSSPYTQQPLAQAQAPMPQYVVVQQLPQGAVPLQNFDQQRPVLYGNASLVDHETAGLLHK